MRLLGLLVLQALLCGCITQTQPGATLARQNVSVDYNTPNQFDTTETIFEGVVHTHRLVKNPQPNSINIIKVDLRDENISFVVTPHNPTPGYNNSETKLQTTLEFAGKEGVQVAVNANFYLDLSGGAYTTGDPADLIGLSASNGSIYSDYNDSMPALVIMKNNEASIITASDPQLNIQNAVAGYSMILTKGVKPPCKEARCTAAHPRTAAGLTKDGRYLILATVDGRQPKVSEGLSLAQLGDLMLEQGAYDAIELDGGGSTTLVISDPAPRVVNTPVGTNNQPNTLRPVGNNLGIHAPPNPN